MGRKNTFRLAILLGSFLLQIASVQACQNTGENCGGAGARCCNANEVCGQLPGAGGNGLPVCHGVPTPSSTGRTLTVDIGTRVDFLTILYRIINFLAITMASLAVAIFIVGALLLTASRGKDDLVTKGKDMMIGAIFGLIVVLGSYAILRTVYYFLYAA